MRKLQYLDHTGHTELDLDTETALAADLFAKVLANGGMAYNTTTKELMREFDPDAAGILLRPRYVGG